MARRRDPGRAPLKPEFALIERIRARAGARADVLLGIGDDAALLQPPEGMGLAWSTDTLVSGVHFPADTAPADIGFKSLAVNLSDLAAMGARPAWATLSLTLPEADADWLDGFLDGFLDLAARHRIAPTASIPPPAPVPAAARCRPSTPGSCRNRRWRR